jgi:hypothetical protein
MSEAYIVSYLNGIQTKMGASHFKKEVSKEPSLSKEPYYTVSEGRTVLHLLFVCERSETQHIKRDNKNTPPN